MYGVISTGGKLATDNCLQYPLVDEMLGDDTHEEVSCKTHRQPRGSSFLISETFKYGGWKTSVIYLLILRNRTARRR